MAKRKATESALASPQNAKKRTMDPHSSSRVQSSSEHTPKMDSKVVEQANSLSHKDFYKRYVDGPNMWYRSPKHSCDYTLHFESAATIKPADLKLCFNLIEETSRQDYEASSRGWHPRRKRREMTEPEMRYLLVDVDHRAQIDIIPLGGFLSFMITHDSTPSVPVLYIYEIHLAESHRGKGMGKHFMNLAEEVARRVGVEKVMLTCFVSNTKAREFYERLGYGIDACSPADRKTRKKTVKADYVILSKRVGSADTASGAIEEGTPTAEDAVPTIEGTPVGQPTGRESEDVADTEPAPRSKAGIAPLGKCEPHIKQWIREMEDMQSFTTKNNPRMRAQMALLFEGREYLETHHRSLIKQTEFLAGLRQAALRIAELADTQIMTVGEERREVGKLQREGRDAGARDVDGSEEDDEEDEEDEDEDEDENSKDSQNGGTSEDDEDGYETYDGRDRGDDVFFAY
ncbi:hypothetical protein LTR85_009485 [Meristemomyces frigidus]|nr:hypothetical protein LTR85_009485 [Meristemomyces frigidus]